MEDYAANRKGEQPGTGGMFGTTLSICGVDLKKVVNRSAATPSKRFNVGVMPANTGSRKSQIYSDFFFMNYIMLSRCV